MHFEETWNLLQQGKLVRRAAWQHQYLVLLPKVEMIWLIDYSLSPIMPKPYNLIIQDVLASDWELLQ